MGRVTCRAHEHTQQEDNMRKAINVVQTIKEDGKPYVTIQDTSTTFGIPFSTLRGRLRPHFLAHQAQQTLTPIGEKASTDVTFRMLRVSSKGCACSIN